MEELGQQGVSFQLDDDDHLSVEAPEGVIDPETSKRLRHEKRQVIAVLSKARLLAVAQEKRRQKVLNMMTNDDQCRKYHWYSDTRSDPANVILALAIRGVGTCEFLIPRAKYDPFLLAKALKLTNEADTKEH